MNKNKKIILGFIAIILMLFVQATITNYLQGNIIESTKQIIYIETPLESIAAEVIAYDAMLTGYVHYALLNAQKENYDDVRVIKHKYDTIGTKLDDLLKRDARSLIQQSRRSEAQMTEAEDYLARLDELNLILVDLEERAFEALENRDVDTAYSLVVSKTYNQYKDELYMYYVKWASVEKIISLELQNKIMEDTSTIKNLGMISSIVLITLVMFTLLLIRSFVIEKSNMYETLYSSSKDAIMLLKPPEFKFCSANIAALQLFEVNNEKKYITLTPADLSPEKQPDGQLSDIKARKMIEKAMEKGSHFFEWTHKAYKGKAFRANVLLSKLEVDGKLYIQATVRKMK